MLLRLHIRCVKPLQEIPDRCCASSVECETSVYALIYYDGRNQKRVKIMLVIVLMN